MVSQRYWIHARFSHGGAAALTVGKSSREWLETGGYLPLRMLEEDGETEGNA